MGHMTRPSPGVSSAPCPACGASASGRFCHNCGSPLGPRPCPSCGTSLEPSARFCHRCGAAASATAAPAGGGGARPGATAPDNRTAWTVAAVVILVSVGAIVWRVMGASAPVPAGGGIGVAQAAPGAVPDISQMSPLERFIRLNDRIMTAAEAGDSTTVQTFLPMALSAYEQLPSVDTDTRYHAGLLNIEAGNLAAARALADSILASDGANLLGMVLRANVAQVSGDAGTLASTRRAFLDAWAAEINQPKLEYQEHRNILDAFRAGAG